MIRFLGFLALFFLLGATSIRAEIGKYPIKNITPAEYKAGIQNIDFAQNRSMNLFVANNLGVLSYNGNTWETQFFRSGKKQRSLAFDESSDRLYVGSQGDFGYFENDWQYFSLYDRIPENDRDFDEVWDVYLYDSKIYFCTFQNIYVFNGSTISVISYEGGFKRSFFTGNRLFTQTNNGQLFEIEGNKLTQSVFRSLRDETVAGVIQKDGGYLIFYNSGYIEFSTQLGIEAIYPALVENLKGNYVNHVLQLSDTRLVISTQRGGLFLFNLQNQLIENISSEHGLQSNVCLRSYQDYSGNLWVGMQNGMAVIDINSPLRLINQDIGLEGSGYEVYETAEGTYYTTSNGVYFRRRGAERAVFLTGTEGPAYGIQLINNNLYVGHHTGLFLLKEEKIRRICSTDGLWQVKQLRTNPQYAVAGTYSGLILFKINADGALEPVQKIAGFDESSRFFEEDRKGRLWVGQYYKGLYRLELSESMLEAVVNQVTNAEENFVWENIILTRIDDELYLGTKKGIFKIDQNTDMIVRDKSFSDMTGDQWIYLLMQDSQKNVHLFTDEKVGFFRQVGLNNYAYIPSSSFQLQQSFNNDLLQISINVSNGVYINANEGFIYYDPTLEDRLTISKEPLIGKIYIVSEDSIIYSRMPFNARVDEIGTIEIVQGTKVIQFLVEAFKLKDDNNRKFRYYLEGFDQDYSDWTNSFVKEYTNLAEGDYSFHVQTFNYLGEIVSGKPMLLKIYPPFYLGTLAKIIYGFLLLGVLILFYSWQRRRYKGRAEEMERAKERQLAEKRQELKKLREDQIESELRHVNNLLASSTMNLVVKNEFIENIKQEIKQVKDSLGARNSEGALQRIIKEIDTTLKLQEDWKQFEYHFDRVHGDFLTRLTTEFTDLTPGEQKLSAFLRLKMDTKEIANLMSISLRGVEVARYRLRKKLSLDKHQNLSKFILEY